MRSKKKLAVIASRFPYPLNKGDKLRLFHQIKYLSQFYELHLYAINEENLALDKQETVRSLCKAVTLFNLNTLQKVKGIGKSLIKYEPIQVGYFYSKTIEQKIKKSLKLNNIDAVYCQLSRTAVYGLTFAGPVVLDYQDCFSKNYERAYNNSSGLKKWFYKREWKSMLRYETKINEDFVAKTIISENDKNMLPFNADKVMVVTNGVDANHYQPQLIGKEFDLLFSGNLNYQPNIDAALKIINELQPLLTKNIPNIKIGIAGNTSNKEILNAANHNIVIHSNVADMRDMYARTKVFIAPLFTGAGLQNKLLEAMCMGIPCVATTVCNQSLKANNEKEIMEVTSIEELAEASIRLLENKELQQDIAKCGQQFVLENYSWDSANNKLYQLIEQYL